MDEYNKLDNTLTVTPDNTEYAFDDLDKWMYENLNCPDYWKIRKAYGAFSSENFLSSSEESLVLLNEIGLHNHLAMTSLAGARYHLHLLRTYVQDYVPLPIQVWEEVAAVAQALYKGWNGLLSSSFAILIPENFIEAGIANIDRGYTGVSLNTKLHSEKDLSVRAWFRDNHPDILDTLLLLKQYHGYRHLDTHRRRNSVRIFTQQETGNVHRVDLLLNPYARPRSVKPPNREEWVEGFELLEEAIQEHESSFNTIWEYIVDLQLHDGFFHRYSLEMKNIGELQ